MFKAVTIAWAKEFPERLTNEKERKTNSGPNSKLESPYGSEELRPCFKYL